jgi:hypothetical protein
MNINHIPTASMINLCTRIQIKLSIVNYLMRDSQLLKKEDNLINQLQAKQNKLNPIFWENVLSPFIILTKDNILQKSKKQILMPFRQLNK